MKTTPAPPITTLLATGALSLLALSKRLSDPGLER